ncbi:MAG TPA: hypothetical protein VNA27_10390 [Rubrobacteraceae bacterium]|jgi:hypothetical protein|nr:hypothetical protein [Rubrobacteraceae bacterium]
MKRILGRLLVLGALAGAVYALRNYLDSSSARASRGDVQVTLDSGASVEPSSAEAQEFVDIARKVLEIAG